MTEQDLRNRWMAAILSFDWSKEKMSQEDDNKENNDKEVLA